MFIAHLPAAYLLTNAITRYSNRNAVSVKTRRSALLLLITGLIASVFPDLDLIYFYLVDGRQNNHHIYWTHVPVFWILFTATALIFLKWINATRYEVYVWVFSLNIMLHLLLDTIVGGILWFYPVSMEMIQVIEVPAVYNWWVANFLWHWTFLFELVILYLAMLAYANRNSSPAAVSSWKRRQVKKC